MDAAHRKSYASSQEEQLPCNRSSGCLIDEIGPLLVSWVPASISAIVPCGWVPLLLSHSPNQYSARSCDHSSWSWGNQTELDTIESVCSPSNFVTALFLGGLCSQTLMVNQNHPDPVEKAAWQPIDWPDSKHSISPSAAETHSAVSECSIVAVCSAWGWDAVICLCCSLGLTQSSVSYFSPCSLTWLICLSPLLSLFCIVT